MDLDKIRQERRKWLEWKNIAPLRQALQELEDVEAELVLGDTVAVEGRYDSDSLRQVAQMMKPWRKGPFRLFGLFIDSEWQSFKKYNLLRPHFNLTDKRVADIGCNNGYYMFRMLEDSPKLLVGFDPSPLFKTQFDLINRFAKSPIRYELLGVEHTPFYEERFDVIFCLGVLYHRSDPIATLRQLYKALDKAGELFIDSFYIDGEEPVSLTPKSTYSKIPNIHFIPTVSALRNWAMRAGFSDFELLATVTTTQEEQRKTEWIDGESLDSFLDPNDPTRTIEGYPSPKRVYARLVKTK